jgi:hypothetical protein
MKYYPVICLLLLFSCQIAHAQKPVNRNVEFHTTVSAETQLKLVTALDTLLLHISQGKVAPSEVSQVGSALSLSIFADLKGIGASDKELHYYKPQLINMYPVKGNQYIISVAFMNTVATNQLRAIFNFIAVLDNNNLTFSIPLHYLTNNWKIVEVGNITYHYTDEINISRAKIFDRKNTQIAQKLGLQPEKLDFYLCNNYQKILHLLGYEYDSEHVGEVSDGYGIDRETIFSIMHNEDFSHDALHYYAGKIRKNARNSASEEGLAYSWGNAYYADDKGEMISSKQLIPVLKQYLKEHPNTSLLALFTKNPMIFPYKTKVRSLISSVICDEVERRNGIPGIKKLIDCGLGDDNYFKIVTKITGITTANFDERLMALVNNYK